MRVEFRQGVPDECVEWLWAYVGPGNLVPAAHKDTSFNEYSWFYERITKPINPNAFGDDPFEYVPTITVNDEKLAMLFMLRWS